MEVAMDLDQLRNQYHLMVQKLREEKEVLRTAELKVKELRRQHLSLKFDSSENDKLLKGVLESIENVQKSSLGLIDTTNENLTQFNEKSKNELKDYASSERAASEIQAKNLQRFQGLSKILSDESIMNMTTEMDQKLNDISSVLESEEIKLKSIKDEFVQQSKERKMLTKNVLGLTMSVKRENCKRVLEKKLKTTDFK